MLEKSKIPGFSGFPFISLIFIDGLTAIGYKKAVLL